MPAVGASAKNAAEMFVNEVNKAGGLEVAGKKHPLTLVIGDNAAKADQAAAVAQRLISQDNVIAMMMARTPAPVRFPPRRLPKSLKCPMISPWSANPKTTVDAYQRQVQAVRLSRLFYRYLPGAGVGQIRLE